MNIAIIGGGFTGLSAAYELAKHGHKVTLFEKDKVLGGLAHGFRRPGWEWHVEAAYHHLFTNDDAILGLIKELGLATKLIIKRPITANYIPSPVIPGLTRDPSSSNTGFRHDGRNDKKGHGTILPFDSPRHLLTYPGLSILDKLRTGALLASIKLNPLWQPFERITAKDLFLTIGGQAAWEAIWEPLMIGKFDSYANRVAASWLWARIKKRTPKLCYIEGGFHTLVTALENAIKIYGGIIHTGTSIYTIQTIRISHPRPASKCGVHSGEDLVFQNARFRLTAGMTKKQSGISNQQFDTVLLTVPTPIAVKLVPHLTPARPVGGFDIGNLALRIPHLHAQTLILETDQPILACPERSRGVYWLNITDRSFPFLAVVAHTNFMDKTHYGGRHITYFGNYLPGGHRYLSMTANQLYNEFLPFIKRLRYTSKLKIQTSKLRKKSLKFKVLSLNLFVGPFAQPVHELHYSHKAPKLTTPIPGLFLANMDSIYPWDRGTNYAVELGKRAARCIMSTRRD